MTTPQVQASIDLDAYRANLQAVAACAPNSQMLAVVKANAYGHGMVQMARAARSAGAQWLGVATLDEALALRTAGDVGRLLCWLASPGVPWAQAIESEIDVAASSAEQLAEIVAVGTPGARVHLKVDTGMSRNGALGPQWTSLIQAAAQAQADGKIEVAGTFSHFACADEPDHPANDRQEQAFRAALDEMAGIGLDPGVRHIANSAATLTRPSAHFDMVRIGIAAYGIEPDPGLAHRVDLLPVMTLQARIAQVKTVPAGSSVSYGLTWTTPVQTRLAVVPVGYGDGIAIAASNKAKVLVGGRRVPVVGRICMDQLVVDLGDVPAERGDVAVLFGPGTQGEPTAQDWATASGTIAYEVVTRLGDRITRTYQGSR